jgi:exosortase K
VRAIDHPWQAGVLVGVWVLVFKHGYAQADATHLQWLLYPLATVLNALSPLHFERLPNGDWWDATHQLVIVKACAGGHFWLVSGLGYLWQWRQRHWAVAVGQACAAAWVTALGANALRVWLMVGGEDELIRLWGLSAGDAHRFIGIAVYFSVLAVQMAGALPVAVGLYWGITLALPALRAGLLGLAGPDAAHVVWTASVPLGVSALWLLGMGVLRHLVIHKSRRKWSLTGTASALGVKTPLPGPWAASR